MIASYSPPKLEYAKLDSPSSKASPDLLVRSGLFLCAPFREQVIYEATMPSIYGPEGYLHGH